MVPVLVQFFGQSAPLYRALGTYQDAAVVLYVGNAFFAAFLFVAFVSGRDRLPQASVSGNSTLRGDIPMRSQGVGLLLLLGLFGMVVRFPSPDQLLAFITASSADALTSAAGGPVVFLSSILRPLFPVAIALHMVNLKQAGRQIWPWVPVVLVALFLALASYGLNRAAIIVPVTAFVLSYTATFGIQVKARTSLWLSVVGIALFFGVGSIRNSIFAASIGAQNGQQDAWKNALDAVLIYGQSPLQSAPVIAASNGSALWSLPTLVNSLVSPLPGISELIRSANGTALYNQVLYGSGLGGDQILMSWLEAYLSLGILGALLMGGALALGIAYFDRQRHRARGLLEKYAYTMGILILSQLGVSSLSATGQSLLYFAIVPILVSWAIQFQTAPNRNLGVRPEKAV